MVTRIELGDIVVEVVRKDIKNIHLSVYPPHGQVRISAPEQFNLHTLRAFAISKLAWIKKQQKNSENRNGKRPGSTWSEKAIMYGVNDI